MGHQKYLEKMFYENIRFNNTKLFIRKSVHLNTEKALFIFIVFVSFQQHASIKSEDSSIEQKWFHK